MNDIDHLLHDAFDSLRVPGDIRPHFGDVRTRARRMHRRRAGGMVGAFTMVGAAAVGLQSLRHDTRAALTPGDGGVDLGLGNDATTAGPTTSIDCGIAIAATTIDTAPTTIIVPGTQPPQTAPLVTMSYEINVGDTPMMIAKKFDISLEDLTTVNAGNTAFQDFLVGATIAIPGTPAPTIPYEPTTSQGASEPYPAPCAPGVIVDTTVWGAVPVETSTTSVEPITPDTVCVFDQSPVYCGPETTTSNG